MFWDYDKVKFKVQTADAETESRPAKGYGWRSWIVFGALYVLSLIVGYAFFTDCSSEITQLSSTSSATIRQEVASSESPFYSSEDAFSDVIRTDSILTKHFPDDTVIPGPSDNWEFLLTSAILHPRTSSIFISSVCEFNFGKKRRKDTVIRVSKDAPQSVKEGVFKILDIPFDDMTEVAFKDHKCKNFKWVGQHGGPKGSGSGICPHRHYCHPYYCWREVIKDPECDHEVFGFTKGSYECMCGIKKCEPEPRKKVKGNNRWPAVNINLYRILPENSWECVLLDHDISTDVMWGPHKAAIGGLTKDVFHKINCKFDQLNDLIKKEDYIHVGLRKKGQPIVAKFHINTRLRLHGHIIPEYIPKDPDPENVLVSKVDPGYLIDGLPRMSLCIGGTYGGVMTYLLENVVHHMNIGFSHIYIGYDEPMDSERFANMTKVLHYFINRGHLTLVATKIKYLQWGPASYMKEQFYDYCLYLGKLKNELMMIIDIDEFVTPYTFEPLPIVLRRFLKDENQEIDDLCSITFSPTEPERAPDFKYINDPGWIGDRLPFRIHEKWRMRNGKEVRKKSIFHTKNIFQGGTHVPGACNTTSTKAFFSIPANLVLLF